MSRAVVKLNGKEIMCVYLSEPDLLTTYPAVSQAERQQILATLKQAAPTALRVRIYDPGCGLKA